MNLNPYLVPEQQAEFQEEIKKSIFITFLEHTPSVDAAKRFVQSVKEAHPTARHHCWGFIAGRPEDSVNRGFSDDGEPSGTAGKPILAQLSGSGVGEITAVVVRYSGGIKLGTGGLVKAYGGGVQQALKLLQTIDKKITQQVKLTLDYEQVSIVQALYSNYEIVEVSAHYQNNVELVLELEAKRVEEFSTLLTNKSSGRIAIHHLTL